MFLVTCRMFPKWIRLLESEQQVTNMGESSAQSAESGDLGNYSTTGDFSIDGLNGINEPEESYIQEPDEYLEQDNLDPIEEANDSFTLSEEINEYGTATQSS